MSSSLGALSCLSVCFEVSYSAWKCADWALPGRLLFIQPPGMKVHDKH